MDLSGTSAIDEALDRVGRAGLPSGLERRVHWRRSSALWVGLVDQYDLIFFKLFAAADSSGPRSVHYLDLIALRPTAKGLSEAAEWVRTQDASSEFATILAQVLRHAREDLEIDWNVREGAAGDTQRVNRADRAW